VKRLHILLLIFSLVALAATVSAATLQNTDGQSYVVEARVDGQIYQATILDGSTISLCDYGCELILVQTGQSLTVQPNDAVVIDNGVLRIQ
jgi:hypothetical protein